MSYFLGSFCDSCTSMPSWDTVVKQMWLFFFFFICQTQNPYHNASLLEQSGLHRITLGTSTISSVSSARYKNVSDIHTHTHTHNVLRLNAKMVEITL